MRPSPLLFLSLLLLCSLLTGTLASTKKRPAPKTLQIGVKFRPEHCKDSSKSVRKSKNGDELAMHYHGTLYDTGKVFDSSVDRGQEFVFTIGRGMVIKGWEQGLLDMCVGEKRRLVIPSPYGDSGSPPVIPPKATLVFDVFVSLFSYRYFIYRV
ncbi:hypothetical protein BKA69DRAFT_1031883 [Paraphysoderma sedebokerense]|nr:hypothetical protein BKA69DRAFT_1031883 [Paraphysoderma sedebokerense]